MTTADFVTTVELENYQSGDAQSIIEQAQSAIRSYCGWHIAPSVTETVTLDGNGSAHMWLPSLRVTDVDSVENEGTVLSSEDYDWSASGYLQLRTWGTWSDRPRQVEVTFTHGYTEAPPDVIEVAAAVASRAATSPAGIVRDQSGPFSVQYATVNGAAGGIALLEHEKAILDRYKLPPRT